MKTNAIILRLFRVLSLFTFIIALFMCYTSLPLEVAVHYDSSGSPDQFITKSELFYGLTAFVVLFNVTFLSLSSLLPGLPVGRLSLPNRAFWQEHPQKLKEILKGWLSSFASVVHTFLIIMLVVMLTLNTSENADVSRYSWVLLVGGVILAGWLIYLPFRLRLKTSVEEED